MDKIQDLEGSTGRVSVGVSVVFVCLFVKFVSSTTNLQVAKICLF